MAAGRTVEHGTRALAALVLPAPGRPDVPILYEVDRIRDGRSFTTRRVVAIQHGRAIFNMAASFHVHERGPRAPVPHARGPRPRVAAAPLSERLEPCKDELADWFDRPHPIDQRHIGDAALDSARSTRARTSACGSGPTATCPTTRCSTPAWPPTPRTCRSSTPSSAPTTCAGTTPTSWAPASTTACGSTGRSGPTSGCSTTPTPPSAAEGRGLARGFLFDRAGTALRLDGPRGPDPAAPPESATRPEARAAQRARRSGT